MYLAIAHNVPAVCDVFVRDKGIAKQFQRTKNVVEKKRTKGEARLRFFVARAAERRRSVYSPVIRSTGVHYYQ
jgi:peptidoglycan hydrolase CwlO-like protein